MLKNVQNHSETCLRTLLMQVKQIDSYKACLVPSCTKHVCVFSFAVLLSLSCSHFTDIYSYNVIQCWHPNHLREANILLPSKESSQSLCHLFSIGWSFSLYQVVHSPCKTYKTSSQSQAPSGCTDIKSRQGGKTSVAPEMISEHFRRWSPRIFPSLRTTGA